MNVLMLSIGHPSVDGKVNETVRRHIDYAKAIQGQIHLICYAPASARELPRQFDGQFFVYNAGAANMLSYVWNCYLKAAKLMQEISFDLIYTQDPFGTALVGGWLKKRFNVPVIVGNHSSFIDNPYWVKERPLLFRLFNIIARFNLRHADALKSVGNEEKLNYIRLLNIDPSIIYVQNTPLKIDLFSLPVDAVRIKETRALLNITEQDTLLIWVGRPVKPKRLNWLLHALEYIIKKRPHVKLLLIGNKSLLPENDEVQTLIQKPSLKEHVIWLEKGVPNHELPTYYQASDIYVHTASYEGLCKTILEAAASGLPVVTTRFSGLDQSMIDGETGFIVPVEDQEAWVDAVIRLTDDRALANKMGKKGRDFVVAHFNYEQGVKNLTGKWQQVARQYKNKEKICVA